MKTFLCYAQVYSPIFLDTVFFLFLIPQKISQGVFNVNNL